MFRAKTIPEALARNSVEAYLHSVSLTSEEQRKAMFSPAMHRELQGYRSHRDIQLPCRSQPHR